MKALATFIIQGGRQATLVVAVMAVLSLLMPPLVIISSAALCLITLREGALEGVKVLIGSTVATALIGYIALATPLIAATYLCVMWLPVFLVSLVLRHTRQMNVAIECLVLLAMLAVISVYVFVDNPAEQWALSIQAVIATLGEQQDILVTQSQLQEGLAFWSAYMTGVVVAGTITSIMISLLLGRWWQGLLFNPGGFNQEFTSIRLQPRDAYAFVVLIVLALLFSGQLAELMWNLDVQLVLLFLIVGVSVVHVIIKNRGTS
ncbi:MAG: DUF2232 domain-containing protein, partial [Cycloclasticus sp.]|nr:DUF2232 domain-containing protein [Cycloclasticus sp.]MBQ0789639.1 DUF2232 domain-containing protein [Cycloclasticus sp.]